MCGQNQAFLLAQTAAKEAREQLGDKCDSVVLYGSYARGDFEEGSDVDLMVKINCSPQELAAYESFFARLSSRLSLRFDVTVSIVTVALETFNRFKRALPFYANVEREGIQVA